MKRLFTRLRTMYTGFAKRIGVIKKEELETIEKFYRQYRADRPF